MPDIGDILRGRELGFRDGRKRIYSKCPECNIPRWIDLRPNTTKRCRSCAGLYRRGYRGGRLIERSGYVAILLNPLDFFYKMTNAKGYVYEHRLIMAKQLGRNLHLWEIVHHKNGIKDDNRIENLQLVSDDRHKQITLLENRIGHLEKRVTILEAENALLKETVNARYGSN